MNYLKTKVLMITVLSSIFLFGMVVNVSAASGKYANNFSNSYVFLSTDGEVCSSTVYVRLEQNYTKKGSKSTYGERSAYVTYKNVATYTIPKVTANNAVFRNSSNTVIKQFSWHNLNSIYPAGKQLAFHRGNSTTVQYNNSATRYYTLSYIVGNSGYMGLPFQSNMVKLSI